MSGSRQTSVTPRRADGRNVLVVDDEDLVREGLQRHLEKIGYVVMEAGDFDRALSVLGGTAIDAMILDVRLPGRSGIELLQHVRSKANLAALPVLILTGYIPETDELALLNKLGASVLYKPQGCMTVIRYLERMTRRG